MPYTALSYFILDPHETEYDEERKLIPIDKIAGEFYGKNFTSLRACQRDFDNVSNDMVVEYKFADDDTYLTYLDNFDESEVYLGYDSRTGKTTVVKNMTEVEYWKTITWLDESARGKTISLEEIEAYEHLLKNEPSAGNDYMQGRYDAYKRGELKVVEVNPPATKDLTNAVFAEEFYAQRAFSPSLGAVIADLIRHDILPRGNFLYRHWW